jgi:DNA-binding LacI/PurR family transcriptional regulator
MKYQLISAELVSKIRSGMYRPGDKLPSENELAASYGASRSTVIRALREVGDQRLITRRQGSGSYVTRRALEQAGTRAAIGLMKPMQSGRYSDSVVDQLQSILGILLQRRNSALIVHSIEKDDVPASIAQSMSSRNVAGVFMVPMPPWYPPQANREVADAIARSGQPLVLLDGDMAPRPQRSEFDVVGTDNRHGGYLQTEHLLKLGLKRILYLGAPAFPTVADRRLGYQEAMRDHGIEPPGEWLCEAPDDVIEADFVAGLIRKHRPEGIVCKSDEFAALLMHHLPPLGVRVPQDLKIVGFDDRPIGSLLPVTLTTVRQPVAEIAEAALALMDARLAKPDRTASYVQLAGKLIVRGSSKA